MTHHYPKKWRPSLGMIVIGMLGIVLCLPLAGLGLFRFYDTQLARETESELIAQAASIGAVMEHMIVDNRFSSELFGTVIDEEIDKREKDVNPQISPILPSVDLTRSAILERRSDAWPSAKPIAHEYLQLGETLNPVIARIQKTTLAGFRILDPFGRVIGGRDEIGQSLAHILEVKSAIDGKYHAVIRERIRDEAPPPLASISRGTQIRIFAAMPVIVENRVAGIIYVSRTPNNVLKMLYNERWRIMLAALTILCATLLLAFVFIRTIKAPLDALLRRTERISQGDREALEPLRRHGTREIAELSEGVLTTSEKLFERSEFINTFAAHVSHELKSPLTSIQGAAELLRDPEMTRQERNRFLDNMQIDTQRLVMLLERLRDLAKAENPLTKGVTHLDELISGNRMRYDEVIFITTGQTTMAIAIAPENLQIIFTNLIENAIHHGASEIYIHALKEKQNALLTITDNGNGISPANATKIFDLFFTTRRAVNGTGMGLGIVQAVLKAHEGDITLKEGQSQKGGAAFEIRLPLKIDH